MLRRSLDELRELEPGRVCLIKPSSLGDVVHATPVLAALRERWPGAHLAWVVNAGLAPLLEGLDGLDEVIRFDRARAGQGPMGWLSAGSFLQGLGRRRFDLAIDLQGLMRSALMTAATRAAVRVGLADAREGSVYAYTHRVETGAAHAVDRMLEVARAFGCDVEAPRFGVAADESDRAWARHVLSAVRSPRVVLNIGARWVTKRWPAEHFAAVAREASRAYGAGIVVVGAPEDRGLVDGLLAALEDLPVLDLCGTTSLTQLAAVARECAVFVSNDSGPLHLAAAAGARVVGIYTCTSVHKTGPYGPKARAVASGIWCAGSCVKTCARMECMGELGPRAVWPVVREQLEAAMVRPTAA